MTTSHKVLKIVLPILALLGSFFLLYKLGYWGQFIYGLKVIAAFGIVLGIIVLVHEFGHYMAARLMGVRVEVFSFGFGKRLFGKKIGETDFRLSLIPLGGFVKMSGEEDYDLEPQNLKPYDFLAKNRGQKIFVLLMGPFMNVVLAFLIFTIINIAGVQVEKYRLEPPVIGYVLKDSPAEKSGIIPGDKILKIGGREIDTWQNLHLNIGANPNETVSVEYERDGKRKKTTIDVKSMAKNRMGYSGLSWDFRTTIGDIKKDEPAFKAGLKDGDIVLSIDGRPLNYFDFSDVIGANAEKTLSVEIKRGEEVIKRDITPRKVYYLESEVLPDEAEAIAKKETLKKTFPGLRFIVMLKSGEYSVWSDYIDAEPEARKYAEAVGNLNVKDRGVIGVGEYAPYSPSVKINYGLLDAMIKSKDDIANLTFFVFDFCKKMVRGRVSADQLSGPIEIAKFSKRAMEQGPTDLFLLIAFISLQLGIINLLPIPALDGGHLMIYSIESIIRKDFSPKVKTILLNTGFVILIALMVFVVFNDILKLF